MESELQLNLRQIVQALEDILGRPSRWNEKAYIARSLSFGGAAHYDGSISISEYAVADPDLRWRTMIHEALHTFSPQYSHPQYIAARGWEEGVVEQMQRLLRPDVLAALQVSINEVVVAEAEVNHPYNVYITALEDLRERLGDSQMSFYRLLLATPLPERALLLKRSSILLADQYSSRGPGTAGVSDGVAESSPGLQPVNDREKYGSGRSYCCRALRKYERAM